jgi:hypothetical protein
VGDLHPLRLLTRVSEMRILALTIVVLFVSGCIWNVDRPSPFEYERWSSRSAAEPVELVMLECGYPSIFGTAGYGFSDDDTVHAEKCMRHSGNQQRGSYGEYICKNKPYVSACSDGYVPRREVQKRLDSPYCHKYLNSEYCK